MLISKVMIKMNMFYRSEREKTVERKNKHLKI